MKNKEQLLNKENWIQYLNLADDGGLTNNAKANDIVSKIQQAINFIPCCETVKEKYTHTFEVDLNSEKRKEQYNKQIEQIHNAPCKVYLYDGKNYIELKP